MARGRWQQDSEGWNSRSNSRGRSANRRWDNRRNGDNGKLLEENKRLQQQLREARGQVPRPVAKGGDGPHPNAKEGPARHGDWQCANCLFGTNRHSRESCYKCAVVKSFSFKQVPSTTPTATVGLTGTATVSATPISISSAVLSPSASTSPSTWTPTAPSGSAAPQSCPPPSSIATASNGSSGPGQPALVGPEGIKALKGQLDKLLAAKAQVASDPLLGHVAAGLEAQIQGVRSQLSCAQPLEVALRGTLGAVASARQALSKAEQKTAKLETQVVAAVAAYEAAASEMQACQKALADAEAATARTAGGRFDPRLLMGSHPGAALAILSEAAAARCIVGTAGVDAGLAERVSAAFAEVQAVCRLLPAEVPSSTQAAQPATGAGATVPSSAAAAADPSEVQMGEGTSRGIAGNSQGLASSDVTVAVGETSASAVLAAQQQLLQLHSHAAADQQHQQLQQQQLQQQQQQLAAQQQAQAAAVELAKQHAQAALAQAAQQTVLQAPPSAVAPCSAEDAIAIAASTNGTEQTSRPSSDVPGPEAVRAAAVPAGPGDDAELGGGGNAVNGKPPPHDDAMGGGASDGIANKRPAADALDTARAIVAKAKARAGL